MSIMSVILFSSGSTELAAIIMGIFAFLLWIYAVGTFVPGMALCVRRFHDIGKHWYRIFMALIPLAGPIILIVDLCKDSDKDNEWGYGPYQ